MRAQNKVTDKECDSSYSTQNKVRKAFQNVLLDRQVIDKVYFQMWVFLGIKSSPYIP